jgi:flagellar hook-basal body complex protein FliE
MAGCLYYITINGVETPMTEEELKAYLEKGGLENLMQSGDIDLSKIKSKEDAVQKPSAKKVLQPTPSGTREARGGRPRVEPSQQGEETTFQAESDEKIQSPRERKKAILNTLLEANLSEETKMLIEDNGTYFQANMEQAEIAAKSILEEIGLENAIIAAKTNEVHPSIGSAIYAEAINSLWSQERQLRSEGETNKADDMALRQAELISDYSDISTSSGQWIAQIKRFYKTSPLGVVRKINTERKKAFDERFAKDKSSFNSLYQQIIKGEEVQSYIKKKAEEIIKEDRKEGRKNKRDSVFKKIDDTAKLWIQKLTSKSAQGAEKMGVGIEDVINKAADAMKKAYIAGESITAIVEDAIEYISDKLGTNEWDIDGFRKDWTDKFSEEAEKKENKYVNALDKRRKNII